MLTLERKLFTVSGIVLAVKQQEGILFGDKLLEKSYLKRSGLRRAYGAIAAQLDFIKICMEHQLKIEGISLLLIEEGNAIRVISPTRNVLLDSQNIENVIQIIEQNFSIVDSFYLKRIEDNAKTTFVLDDIHSLSVSIVLYYLHMYNIWRIQYTGKKYQDLGFKQDDFQNPSTNDIIFSFYQNNYPDDWEIKCAVLMAMELEDLKRYYERRVKFYNK